MNVDTGMAEELFLPGGTIEEVYIKGRTKPYYMGTTYNPIVLNLSFAFLQTWDEELIKEITRLFDVDYYKPLWFEESEDTIYFCKPMDDARIIHNSLKQGYVEIQLRCNDRYTYSRVKKAEYEDFTEDIRFSNRGDTELYPQMICVKSEDGEGIISIENKKNDVLFLFEDIDDGEIIYIDNENEIIKLIDEEGTEISGIYRYNNHNGKFLKMEIGSNNLEVVGLDLLKFEWRFKTLQN